MSRRPFKRRGQALVEFALVFPFVLLTFLAIFDVARIMFTSLSLDAAAARAARLVAMNRETTSPGDVYKDVIAAAPGVRIPPQAIRIDVLAGPGGVPLARVRIEVEHQVFSAFYATSRYRIQLRGHATAAYQGADHFTEARVP